MLITVRLSLTLSIMSMAYVLLISSCDFECLCRLTVYLLYLPRLPKEYYLDTYYDS